MPPRQRNRLEANALPRGTSRPARQAVLKTKTGRAGSQNGAYGSTELPPGGKGRTRAAWQLHISKPAAVRHLTKRHKNTVPHHIYTHISFALMKKKDNFAIIMKRAES